jgi:hypothetical protein
MPGQETTSGKKLDFYTSSDRYSKCYTWNDKKNIHNVKKMVRGHISMPAFFSLLVYHLFLGCNKFYELG